MNTITLLLVVLTCLAHAKHRNRKEDKLVLSPIELIDLVRQEQHKNKQPLQTSATVMHTEKSGKPLEPDDSEYETAHANHRNRKEDKLVLSPIELIDLLWQEQHKSKPPLPTSATVMHTEKSSKPLEPDDSEYETVSCEDDQTLKNRKIWSRWSKWGDCSVTCGSGIITRYRVCVAGRCAPGEREEQRRPCARAPCHANFNNMTDDLRDSDN